MEQKDRTSQKPQTSPYHEHDPLPQGALPESPAVASANECTGLMFTPPEEPGPKSARGRPPTGRRGGSPVHGRGPGQAGALPFWGSFRRE